jgi:DnaK suppressor protein
MEELTDEERETLAEALHALKQRLTATLESQEDAAKPVELDQTKMGRVSRIDAIQQQEMARSSEASARRRLALVRQALKALEEDEYGYCRLCEEPIAFRRLQARPESPFCVECQGKRERR